MTVHVISNPEVAGSSPAGRANPLKAIAIHGRSIRQQKKNILI